MEAWHWILQHWLDLLQSAGIVSGFCFTVITLRRDEESRRIGNLLKITSQHREIWQEIYARPELTRVLKVKVDLRRAPVTDQEAIFLTLLILHLNAAYRTMQAGMFVTPEGLTKDIHWFMSLPIPSAVWERSKPYQDAQFVRFVEQARQ